MIVAGVMSGTSADGINVALVRISERGRLRHTILAHAEYPFPAPVRRAILSLMNAESARVADLARLNFLLGELYADAIAKTARQHRIKIDMVGCHGQTLYHQGTPARFLGHSLAVTWQTGEGAVIAARLGVPVVSDFRPSDMAAGGKGAPLVPFLDYVLYRDAHIGRIAQNIGGIANLTSIPAKADPTRVVAFDTGPGNMLIDAVTERLFKKRYDRDGRIAASGQVLDRVIKKLIQAPFFRQTPPKTAGREEFGHAYAQKFLRLCERTDNRDAVATATALTAKTITDAIRRFVLRKRGNFQEIVISGGGAKNPTLMAMLRNELAPHGITLRFSDEFGVPTEAKEAVAFAVMAYETWHRRPSNVPSATGAKRPAILGKISYA